MLQARGAGEQRKSQLINRSLSYSGLIWNKGNLQRMEKRSSRGDARASESSREGLKLCLSVSHTQAMAVLQRLTRGSTLTLTHVQSVMML